MKKFRKLIPAFVLLLISTAIMSSATFAWFSMNTTVEATGMQVTAKSNNTFLLIGSGEDDTAGEIQTANSLTTAVTVDPAEAYVFPAKPVEADDVTNVISSATAITAATADNPERWYTAASTDPAHSTTNSSGNTVFNAQVLSSGNFSDYVIKRTVYLTLAAGSDDAYNLMVNLSSFTDGLPVVSGSASATDKSAVRVLVVSGTNMIILDPTMVGTPQSLHGTLNQTVTDDAVVRVDIYIYYDGSAESVYTNNIANLTGAQIELEFKVEVKPAA